MQVIQPHHPRIIESTQVPPHSNPLTPLDRDTVKQQCIPYFSHMDPSTPLKVLGLLHILEVDLMKHDIGSQTMEHLIHTFSWWGQRRTTLHNLEAASPSALGLFLSLDGGVKRVLEGVDILELEQGVIPSLLSFFTSMTPKYKEWHNDNSLKDSLHFIHTITHQSRTDSPLVIVGQVAQGSGRGSNKPPG